MILRTLAPMRPRRGCGTGGPVRGRRGALSTGDGASCQEGGCFVMSQRDEPLTVAGRTSGMLDFTTETSRYIVDFDAKTITRTSGMGTGVVVDIPVETSTMRRDERPIKLVEVMEPEVGKPAELLVTGLSTDPDVGTVKVTTIVTSIMP